MKWLSVWERKLNKFAIKDLMIYIVVLNAVIYGLDLLVPQSNIINKLLLHPTLVMNGEIWRLITFIFIPPNTSLLWIVFALYFYYMVGTGLENQWGSFKFNLYYLIGLLATIATAFITWQAATPIYLNLSLFLAFAYLFPNFEILLFLFLPVKVKYLAWLNWLFIIYTVVFHPLPLKLLALASVLNFFLFFGKDLVTNFKTRRKVYENRKRFRDAMKDRK